MQKKKTGGNLLLLCSVLALCFVSPVYANEVATKIESLSDFLLQIVQAAGVIVILFGIFSFGAGWLAHDSLSLIHISEPTRLPVRSRMPSSA